MSRAGLLGLVALALAFAAGPAFCREPGDQTPVREQGRWPAREQGAGQGGGAPAGDCAAPDEGLLACEPTRPRSLVTRSRAMQPSRAFLKDYAFAATHRRQFELDMDRSALLLQRAYHALMAGEPEGPVRRRFARDMPRPFREMAKALFADILDAIAGFDPVTQRVF